MAFEGRARGNRSTAAAKTRWSSSVTVGCACLLLTATAQAQVTGNFQSSPIGERAAGMGGAGVAMAEEASGAYYNPAGLAFAESDSIAVGSDLYGLVGGTYNNLFGTGEDFKF